MSDQSKKRRVTLTISVSLLVLGAIILFSRPPIPQPLSYHNFADQRDWLGVSNFMDVVSNLPFLVIGIGGVSFALSSNSQQVFLTQWHRLSYVVFFAGVGLTFFGSCYYHLDPTNSRLVWDRLPMTLGFMGLFSAILSERLNPRLGELLLPLVIVGGFSVGYWHVTESLGRGDLRPYLLVQFGSLLAITALLALPGANTDTWCIAAALAFYAFAKLFEAFDRQVFNHLHMVSGHTLKHLAAGVGTYFIFFMLEHRVSAQHREARKTINRRSAVAQ